MGTSSLENRIERLEKAIMELADSVEWGDLDRLKSHIWNILNPPPLPDFPETGENHDK